VACGGGRFAIRAAHPRAALIPQIDFELYQGAPQGLFVTHMYRVNADIARFLKDLTVL
tara:strand:- start:2976 stop:3149 length:174 start_codon:yes stop_codon:yes gene_type:complete